MDNITRTSTTELIMELTKRIESAKAYEEQTGREETLQAQVKLLEERIDDMRASAFEDAKTIERLKAEVNALEQPEKPTMPVIPKDVAIAIFREGMAYGAGNVCDELDNAPEVCIEESEYCGGFEVSFTKDIDLCDHLDTDYLRSKAVDNSDEEWVVDCLNTLCSDNKFECRIHGVDDQEEKKND